MKYMLLIYEDENALDESGQEACYQESALVANELAAKGKLIGAGPLQMTPTANTVRVREGKSVVTTGPFAETHEQLGGYFLIDVEDLDEAMFIASKLPSARFGSIEVRPLVEIPGLKAH